MRGHNLASLPVGNRLKGNGMSFPLTSALHRDYPLSAGGVPLVGFGSPGARRTSRHARFFYCPTPANHFMDGASRELKSSQDLALSSNLLVAVHPHLEVRARLNRLARRNIMRTSKSASAPSKFISAIFNSATPDGLELTEHEWENEYRGTEAAFIKSGIIKPDWIPGQLGNAKKRVRVGIVDGRMTVLPPRSLATDYQWSLGYICITKSTKGNLVVSVNCLEQEVERREEIGCLARKKERIEEARKQIDKSIAELPTSPEDYLGGQLHTIRAFTSTIRISLAEGFGYSGGYGFPSELISEFDSIAARLNQLVSDAPISFNQEKKQKEIACIKKKVLAGYVGITDKDIEP
jgi:hypothetical protein